MVQRTPLVDIPYVEPGDFPNQYPITSQELAQVIDTWLTPIVGDAGFDTSGSGSSITVYSATASIYRPSLCLLNLNWTQGATDIPAGAGNFVVGTLTDPVFHPFKRSVGAMRQNAGAGIVEIAPDGQVIVKWTSGTVATDSSVYASFTYQVVAAAVTGPGSGTKPAGS